MREIQSRDNILVHFGRPGRRPPSGSGPAGGRQSGLERALREAIRTGRLAPRARLPANRRPAAEPGLPRGTVQAAYERPSKVARPGYLLEEILWAWSSSATTATGPAP
ncbi:hypothetical protein GCM10010508_24620 [Streptomyces naganishii JCM 4654]|uniref:GntR family transcriptional regulator n=1 Tax=Streptomyces naganishii JCM 4654 TaxID=1306179 RepID=A0A919CV72_9ACTN|nr:hypothetical protein GCM10010508_24620 [Streptomyces naganishii JCM 4654]